MSERSVEHQSPDESTSAVARRTVEDSLAEVRRCLLRAAEAGHDQPEPIHDLRVAVRRATTALELFEGFLPRRRTARMLTKLQRIREAANDARDCDVILNRLEGRGSSSSTPRLIDDLRERRRNAQEPIIEASERLERRQKFERRIAELVERVRPRRDERDVTFEQWAPSSLRRFVDPFAKVAESTPAGIDGLHRLRICGKHLRYAIEVLSPGLPTGTGEELGDVLEAIQDRLGEVNDLGTQLKQLYRRRRKASDEDLDHLDALAHRDELRLKEALRSWHEFWPPERQRAFIDRLRAMVGVATAAKSNAR